MAARESGEGRGLAWSYVFSQITDFTLVKLLNRLLLIFISFFYKTSEHRKKIIRFITCLAILICLYVLIFIYTYKYIPLIRNFHTVDNILHVLH